MVEIPNPLDQPYLGPLPNPLYNAQPGGLTSRSDRIKRWKSINSGTLTVEECAQLWIDAGGKREDAAMAAVITRPESGGRVDVVNGIGATGLWQIYDGRYPDERRKRYLQNAWNNAKEAVRKRRAKPTTWGPNPWAVCNDAACSNLAAEAAKVGLPGPLDQMLPDAPNLQLPGLEAIASALRNISESFFGIITFFFEFARRIGDPQTWLDALKVGGGLILIYMGLKRLFTVTI